MAGVGAVSAAAERRQAIVALEAKLRFDRSEAEERELERLRRLERWQRVEGKR